ncbi:uncharacterized protein SPPG_05746 [Spizellomyces punctatus DAOM BR117]|uniref:Uncharacterized protein n=1 Tax=Spizellomyces punctatus (strain DAOM BR117) TaxID=645134 RepID=A0A0L0HCW0_SPIPD|nr:uncharacterized protein SPPG_05746 [Spizellomyces punctatus DAOM BR117]KNC98764.1 hypothetical protein SPPG_05746 [Spizellomyces punctatus DAOM BR117]|eukprot:XP_016606804.1 hypothetical protein SPPG_05746 [Spizellomyces punctatus DAOM BR117]
MFRIPFSNRGLGADVANDLFQRACHAEYGTASEQGNKKTSAGRKRRGRRDRMRRFRRSHATDATERHGTPAFRSNHLRRRHRFRRALHLGGFKFHASDSESSTLNQSSGDENMRTKQDEVNRILIRQERQRRRHDDLNDAELYALNPFLSIETNQVPRNSRRSSATSVSSSSLPGRRVSASHGKLIKPAPGAIGVAKLKSHDGPSEPMVEKKYHTGDTHFPDLRPEAETTDEPSTNRSISFYVTPRDIYDLTPRDVQLRAQLMRELVSWYFYSRWTSPALQGGEERATAPEHPAKMCLPSFKMERLSPLMETEDENQEGFDVFAGIGTKGFTFALSKIDRRTLRPTVAPVATPPTQSPNDAGTPTPASPAVVNPFRGTYKHRMRRVSLTPDLEIAQMGNSATNIPVMADFGKVKTNAAPLIKPRDRAKRHRGPSKFGKAWGTSLGPWVDHDPDLCDRHDHSRYLIDVAGSVNAYREEHETGWTSHSQLQAVWSQLAVAEGGQFEHTQMSEEHKKDFKQLFEKLLDVTFGDKKGSENIGKIEEKQKRQKDPGAAIRSLALGVV